MGAKILLLQSNFTRSMLKDHGSPELFFSPVNFLSNKSWFLKQSNYFYGPILWWLELPITQTHFDSPFEFEPPKFYCTSKNVHLYLYFSSWSNLKKKCGPTILSRHLMKMISCHFYMQIYWYVSRKCISYFRFNRWVRITRDLWDKRVERRNRIHSNC